MRARAGTRRGLREAEQTWKPGWARVVDVRVDATTALDGPLVLQDVRVVVRVQRAGPAAAVFVRVIVRTAARRATPILSIVVVRVRVEEAHPRRVQHR